MVYTRIIHWQIIVFYFDIGYVVCFINQDQLMVSFVLQSENLVEDLLSDFSS